MPPKKAAAPIEGGAMTLTPAMVTTLHGVLTNVTDFTPDWNKIKTATGKQNP
jgi:hypothetical protein